MRGKFLQSDPLSLRFSEARLGQISQKSNLSLFIKLDEVHHFCYNSLRGDITMNKSNRHRIEMAKKHFQRIRELVAQKPSPFAGMTEEEVIEQLRKTRKRLWEKKLVART